jgi:flagellin
MTMISINTNYGGIFAAKASSQSQLQIDQAMERLSTGKRINHARDDAAGQAIATRLSAEIEGLAMASRNVADGQSLVDTAEGALVETHALLLRMREIGVQAANGTLSSSDNEALDAEFQQLVAEIDRISDNTSWAGTKLLNGNATGDYNTSATFTFQAGVNNATADRITIDVKNADSATLGVKDLNGGANVVNLLSMTNAQAAITKVDDAIASVSAERGKLGAVSNRMSSTMANLDQITVNLTASKGRIEDSDFAAETGNLAKGQILQQAATAMLAQANASKQQVLTLIR